MTWEGGLVWESVVEVVLTVDVRENFLRLYFIEFLCDLFLYFCQINLAAINLVWVLLLLRFNRTYWSRFRGSLWRPLDEEEWLTYLHDWCDRYLIFLLRLLDDWGLRPLFSEWWFLRFEELLNRFWSLNSLSWFIGELTQRLWMNLLHVFRWWRQSWTSILRNLFWGELVIEVESFLYLLMHRCKLPLLILASIRCVTIRLIQHPGWQFGGFVHAFSRRRYFIFELICFE